MFKMLDQFKALTKVSTIHIFECLGCRQRNILKDQKLSFFWLWAVLSSIRLTFSPNLVVSDVGNVILGKLFVACLRHANDLVNVRLGYNLCSKLANLNSWHILWLPKQSDMHRVELLRVIVIINNSSWQELY